MKEENNKPVLDEQTFAKLLEAAYVLQEHNRDLQLLEESLELHSERLRQMEEEEALAQAAASESLQPAEEAPQRDADYTLTLAEIVEAQHQIQIRHLEKDAALALVAERLMRITRASGAGIAILDDKIVRYRAGAGSTALPVGSESALTKAVCATCIRTGQVLRTPDVNTEFLFDPDLCRSRGVYSLVAVPVYHNGEIVGALELYFERLNGFAEQDIHTCQLMAGLVTEAIGRDSESSLKKSIAAERTSMLSAIEKLKPSLASMAEDQAAGGGGSAAVTHLPENTQGDPCWKCGNHLVAEEQFCGKCGAAQPSAGKLPEAQSKAASAFSSTPGTSSLPDIMHRPGLGPGAGSELARALDALVPAPSQRLTEQDTETEEDADALMAKVLAANQPSPGFAALSTEIDSDPAHPGSALQPAEPNTRQHWTSAAKAREFLEGVSGSNAHSAWTRFLSARRGDLYLAIALLFVAVVIYWGVGSSKSANAPENPVSKAARRKPAPDADLSAFDKMLISLGLAEAPEAPNSASKGNPDTQVWVDVHTALYYCPGADLYGKTPNGKFTSQRDAQLDQFEPALRKTCE